MVGAQRVKVLSMKEPPGQTFAHILGDLIAVPGEFIACLEWQRAGEDRMRREIQSRPRHFFNKRVSLINYVSPEAKAEEMLVDESATATVKQLGDALTEMEVNGHVFGRCSLTVVLHSEERRALDQQAAQAVKVLAAHDGAFFDETYNLLNAWVSIVVFVCAVGYFLLHERRPRRPQEPKRRDPPKPVHSMAIPKGRVR